jgi:hypothetical protein
MLRVVIYVTLLAVLFGGAVLSAGNAIGAWEPMPPAPTPHVLGTSTQVEKPKRKHKAPAKPRKQTKATKHS